MSTPVISREKIESIIHTYITRRGPERSWDSIGRDCGYVCGKSLQVALNNYAPLYGLSVPRRVYQDMTRFARALVEEQMSGRSCVAMPNTPYPLQPLAQTQAVEGLGEAGVVLDEFVAESEAAEKAAGVEKAPKGHFPVPPAFSRGTELPTYYSRPDNSFTFGVASDSHLGSKYCRMDALNDLYDRFERAKVDRVFHAGNWIDGYIARINHHDLEDGCHSMEGQLRNLVAKYPRRNGIITYAVTGDDHEGWWARQHGFDIGDRAQDQMRKAGREDWVDLGYMEAHIRLVNSNTGKEAILAVVHPGGGTSYAVSYHPQKFIESLEGGEKPAVVIFGHLHKLAKFNIRNVWMLLAGCTQDQTPFIRLRVRQEVHVGGMIVNLEQDPETGAIVGCGDKMLRYFVRSYYGHTNNRWNKSGPVNLPPRSIAGL